MHTKKESNNNHPPNPFDNKDPEKVWKELLANSYPIPKKEALKQMEEAVKKQQAEKSKK